MVQMDFKLGVRLKRKGRWKFRIRLTSRPLPSFVPQHMDTATSCSLSPSDAATIPLPRQPHDVPHLDVIITVHIVLHESQTMEDI